MLLYVKYLILFKKIFKEKNLTSILLPMFIMIKPGIFMDAKRCLKTYKCISAIYKKKFFPGRMKLILNQKKN